MAGAYPVNYRTKREAQTVADRYNEGRRRPGKFIAVKSVDRGPGWVVNFQLVSSIGGTVIKD